MVYLTMLKVRVIINEQQITKNPSLYPYKAYLANLLSYSNIVKGTSLQSQGWFTDLAGHFGPTALNSGFVQRSNLFREGNDATKPYKQDGCYLMGRLHHDLISTETALPPGTKIQIELERSKDSFVIMRQTGDNENYHMKILNINLYLQIAQLSQAVYQEFSSLFSKPAKDNKTNAVTIHFRRTEVRPITITKNSQEFYSDVLYNDELPLRLCIVVVKTSAKNGDYSENAFELNRRWVYIKSSKNVSDPSNSTERQIFEERLRQLEEISERKLRLMQEKFELLQQELSSKGKGRGKRSQPQPSTSASSTRTLRQNLADVRLETNVAVSSEHPAPSEESFEIMSSDNLSQASLRSSISRSMNQLEAEASVYIQKLELTLNGSQPLDQIEDKQGEFDAMTMFWRLNQFSGLNNSPFSNGLSYQDFVKGSFVAVFDNTTRNKTHLS